MAEVTASHAEQCSVLDAARAAADEIAATLHRASGDELAELMVLLDEVAAVARASQAQVAVEAVRRGVVSGREVDRWVKVNAPSLRQGGWYPMAKIAGEVAAASRGSGLEPGEGPVALDPSCPLGVVWAAMTGERLKDDRDDPHIGVPGSAGPWLSAPSAVAVLGEVGRLKDRLVPEAVPTVAGALVELVSEHGTGTMRRLRPALISRHGVPGELDRMQERLAASAYLSTAQVRSLEVTEYALAMTPAQAAVLEAAIGPLSAPQPDEETKEPDLRPSGQRRVEALTEVLSRASAAQIDQTGLGDGAAGSAVALHVTMTLDDLRGVIGLGDDDAPAGYRAAPPDGGSGAGEVLGSMAGGVLIGPAQLRRIACDAVLVPYVLGGDAEVIDQGMAVRLFTRAQRRRLTMRDRGCTYPGCGAPAAWCEGHHVRWWEHDGLSDIANGALLCRRHHTVVHQRRLWAEVREKPDDRGRFVIWDMSPGSYDRALTKLRERERCVGDRRADALRAVAEATDRERPTSAPPPDIRAGSWLDHLSPALVGDDESADFMSDEWLERAIAGDPYVSTGAA